MIRQFGIYLSDEVDHWTGSRFVDQTRTVLALFERHLKPPRESGKMWKISIEVVSKVRKPKVREVLGHVKIQIEDNSTAFFDLTAEEKKRQTLDWLFRGIEIVTQAYGWDMKPYEDAREAVLDLNYVNHWTWKKRAWWRNGRRLVAEVFVEHEVEVFRVHIQLRNRSGEVLERTLVISERPDEFIFSKYFGALQWIDDHTVKLISKSWSDEPDKSVTFDQRHFPD